MKQSADGLPREERASGDREDLMVHDRFESLSRLRDRVEVAAQEITRLRKENADLAERILTLESRPVDDQPVPFEWGEDPNVMRQKIDNFIEAIDSYLDEDGGNKPD